MRKNNNQDQGEARESFGLSPEVPKSARETVNEMVDAGLLDDLMDRVDEGGLQLAGEGGFLPEMIKARPRAWPGR